MMNNITCITCGSKDVDDMKVKMAPHSSLSYAKAKKKIPLSRTQQGILIAGFISDFLAVASCRILNLAYAPFEAYAILFAIVLFLSVLTTCLSISWNHAKKKQLGKAVTEHHFTCLECGKHWTWREDKPYPTGKLSHEDVLLLLEGEIDVSADASPTFYD